MNHPARFTPAILDAISGRIPRGARVLDPFAGTGLIHQLPFETVGVEIEPEWATMHPRTIVGNALALPFPAASFDAVATSPCYGNRFADHHVPVKARQRTYRQNLGRALHAANAGQLQWGQRYQDFHAQAWLEVRRVLRPQGAFLLNVSNHIRNRAEAPVVEWHIGRLGSLGFRLREAARIETTRFRYGQNHRARVEGEWVLALELVS